MRKIIYACFLSLLILGACSPEDENGANEKEISTDVNFQKNGNNGNSPTVYHILVEYQPGTTNKAKENLRQPFYDAGEIIDIIVCTANPDQELWVTTLAPNCWWVGPDGPCRPKVKPPTDPDGRISQVSVSSTCGI